MEEKKITVEEYIPAFVNFINSLPEMPLPKQRSIMAMVRAVGCILFGMDEYDRAYAAMVSTTVKGALKLLAKEKRENLALSVTKGKQRGVADFIRAANDVALVRGRSVSETIYLLEYAHLVALRLYGEEPYDTAQHGPSDTEKEPFKGWH